MFSAAIVLALCASTMAHNWVNSHSRSEFASTVFPTLPSPTGLPHVKVIAGQRFQIEWVTGHDADVYFVLAKEKGSLRNMLQHKRAMLDDYLNNAPAADKKMPALEWQKFHRKYKSKNLDNKSGDGLFMKQYNYDDSKPADKQASPYMVRPESFEGRFSGAPKHRPGFKDVSQMQYKQSGACVEDDRRTMYHNEKYPWVIGMHRYRICTNQGSRPDVAAFAFPKGTEPGRYVVHYNWRGYYDVIDVEIVAGTDPVALPYGEVPEVPPLGTPAHYRRVDHCVFPDAQPVGGCSRMITDARACMDMCDRLTDVACSGVGIMPVVNPDTVYPAFKDKLFVPFEFGSDCPKNLKRNATPNDRVCVALKAREKTDTVSDHFVTDDPEDPAFYSTCLIRIPFKVAPSGGTLPSVPRPLSYEFRGKCLGCEAAAQAQFEYAIPRWGLSDVCANCEVDGVTQDTLPAAKRPINWEEREVPWKFEGNEYCAGVNGDYDKNEGYTCTEKPKGGCVRRLFAESSTRAAVSLHDCQQLAKNRDECTNNVFMRRVGDENPAYCYCWRTESCCGPCQPKKSNSWRRYTNK